MGSMDDVNRALREAVAARYAAAAATTPSGLPADLPEAYRRAIEGFTLTPAVPAGACEIRPTMLSATLPPERLQVAWDAVRQKAEAVKRDKPAGLPAKTCRLFGICGDIAGGKNTTAECIPGAVVIGFADPLYAMLSAMLELPESWLRDRANKDTRLPVIGKSPRQLLQTLGTEWGRGLVAEDVWVRLGMQRAEEHASRAYAVAFADVRFDNEARAIRERGGEVWRVVRTGGTTPADSHSSEAGVSDALIDRTIYNVGTVDELRRLVAEALKA